MCIKLCMSLIIKLSLFWLGSSIPKQNSNLFFLMSTVKAGFIAFVCFLIAHFLTCLCTVDLGMFRASSRVLKFVRCRNGISMILLKSTSLALRPTLVGFLEDMSTDNICRCKVVPLMEVSQLLQLRSKDLQREAKVWNCVLEKSEKMAGIERGSIRDIVLIQTLALQMDEILYDLCDHSVGLNCGKSETLFVPCIAIRDMLKKHI
ncbi:uncharacterized protein LOC113347281 isoform X2 [Papaver somniferum]|nr:uncharacterized protein LOC113347281 isoform X2 [Papaver somniferum]